MTLINDTLTYEISAGIDDTNIGDLFCRDEEVHSNADSDSDGNDDVANAIDKNAANRPTRRPKP